MIIIGGGPTGIAAAIAAQEAGLQFLVLEKGVLVNSLYHFPTNMTFFSTSKLLEIGRIPFVAHSDKPTRSEALEYYRRVVEHYQLPVQTYTRVEALTRQGAAWQVRTNRGVFNTAAVVIAVGYYDVPRLLGIPGENLPKVRHYYTDVHPYVGQNVVVVGAANSACDVALELFYKGAKSVTMVIREPEIYRKVKYWIRPNIVNRIKEGSIQAYFESELTEITPTSVKINTPEGAVELANDFVLAMTGYQPDYSWLKKMGIEISDNREQRPVYNPETLETNLPNVYLAGVVNAGLNTSELFIENTRHHGAIIIKQLLQNREVQAS